MAATVAPTDGQTTAERRPWNVNPVAVTVVVAAAAWLLATAAIMVSLFILHGQTTARIDTTRIELQASIEATRTELSAEVGSVDARVDAVFGTLAGIGAVADDIAALRDDVATLARPPTAGAETR